MNPRTETFFSALIALSALAVASTFVYQQFSGASRPAATNAYAEYVDGWQGLLTDGERIGPEGAAVEIVEFGDFECPFCRLFHDDVIKIMSEHPGEVSLQYFHYPLEMHRHAREAALAATCAGYQGRFAEMAKELFEGQEEFGQREWISFAGAAAVADSSMFATCLSDGTGAARIAAHRSLGEQLNVRATPTVIINGWRLAGTPTADSLRRYVEEISRGEEPFND